MSVAECKVVMVGNLDHQSFLVKSISKLNEMVCYVHILDSILCPFECDGKLVNYMWYCTKWNPDYDQFRLLYYPHTDVVVMFYEINSMDSFSAVQTKVSSSYHSHQVAP